MAIEAQKEARAEPVIDKQPEKVTRVNPLQSKSSEREEEKLTKSPFKES